jgi:hypothetical protein
LIASLIAPVASVVGSLAGCSVDDGHGGTSACTSAASVDLCSGNTVCIGDACTAAFPHAYVITNISATAPNMKSDGTPWDTDGDGTPDIYVDISVAGAVVASTPVNPNSFNATFAGPFTVDLTDGTALDLQSSDKDTPGSEVIYDCPIPMVTAALLRTRYVLCSGAGGVTLNYTIDPGPAS